MSEHELCEAAKHPVVVRDSRVKVSLGCILTHHAMCACIPPLQTQTDSDNAFAACTTADSACSCWSELGSQYVRMWLSDDQRAQFGAGWRRVWWCGR